MIYAPIVFFTYNRPFHTEKSINSLKSDTISKDSYLYVFSDGPKNNEDIEKVNKVRNIIKNINGFKKVFLIEKEENFGLANSIINGVTDVINKHGRAIVLEDDLICSKKFLRFMNEMLIFYENEFKVFSITGYNFPKDLMKIPKSYKYDIYFSPRCSSWGWATWQNRWEKADWDLKDFDDFLKNKKLLKKYILSGEDKIEMLKAQRQGKIDSWATRWEYAQFKNNAYTAYPVNSFVNNIGFDGSGINCDYESKYSFKEGLKDQNDYFRYPPKIKLNNKIMREFRKVFMKDKLRHFKKIIKIIIFYDKWKKKNQAI